MGIETSYRVYDIHGEYLGDLRDTGTITYMVEVGRSNFTAYVKPGIKAMLRPAMALEENPAPFVQTFQILRLHSDHPVLRVPAPRASLTPPPEDWLDQDQGSGDSWVDAAVIELLQSSESQGLR